MLWLISKGFGRRDYSDYEEKQRCQTAVCLELSFGPDFQKHQPIWMYMTSCNVALAS